MCVVRTRALCLHLCVAMASGLRVTQIPSGGDLSSMIPGGMPSIPGMEGQMPSMEDIMKVVDDIVVALQDPKLVSTVKQAVVDLEAFTNKSLDKLDQRTHKFASDSANATIDTIVELFVESAREQLAEYPKNTQAIMKILTSVLSATKMSEAGKKNVTDLVTKGVDMMGEEFRKGVSELNNATVADVCKVMAPVISQTKELEKNLTTLVPQVPQIKSMLPMVIPMVCGQHPEYAGAVQDILVTLVDSVAVSAERVSVSVHKWNTEARPVFTEKLSCGTGAALGAAPPARRLGVLATGLAALAAWLSL